MFYEYAVRNTMQCNALHRSTADLLSSSKTMLTPALAWIGKPFAQIAASCFKYTFRDLVLYA